jgi:hypothetical protein
MECMLQVESTIEGENIMRMARLEVEEPPAMAPCLNVTCRITEGTPLWGKTYWDLEQEGAAVYVAIAATDNQHFQDVFVRRFYVVSVRFLGPLCNVSEQIYAMCLVFE